MKKTLMIIVVLFVIITLGIVYSQVFSPNLAPQKIFPKNLKSACISNPGIITQSVIICGGRYFDGMEIRGNDIKVKCEGSVFDGGSNPSRPNGLLIDGSYFNITVEGCTFTGFPENGILLKGPSNALSPISLTGVFLIDINSSGNKKDGLKVGENTYQIDVVKGKYKNNQKNGIHLVSEYKDPLRYLVNPDPYPKYFPNDVRIFNASASDNGENGIYVDGTGYIRYLDDMEKENNTIIIEGNEINNNLGYGIKNTDFFVKRFNDAWVMDGHYYVVRNSITHNVQSGIKVNTERVQTGSIRCDNSRLDDNKLSQSDIDIVYSNNLLNNGVNGIEVTTDSYSNILTNNCYYSPIFVSSVKDVYNNVIESNGHSGIYYHLAYPFGKGVEGHFGSVTGQYDLYGQNIIVRNGKYGVFVNNSASKKVTDRLSGWRTSRTTFGCNDIISNNGDGARFSGYKNVPIIEEGMTQYFYDFNIIENNKGDGISTIYSPGYGINDLYVDQSFISNNNGIEINHNLDNTYGRGASVRILRNDIIGNPLLAFDSLSFPYWTQNYWSDYSPSCIDNPPDGWCDFPRPIPTSNQDTQPKAGSPYFNNARGYLQAGVVGVAPMQSCISSQVPSYPMRPTPIRPDFNKTKGVGIS